MSDKVNRNAQEAHRPDACCGSEPPRPLIHSIEVTMPGCGGQSKTAYGLYGETTAEKTAGTTDKSNFGFYGEVNKSTAGCRDKQQVTELTQQFSCSAAAVDKLGALSKLAAMGQSRFQAKDERGQCRDYAIELEQVGSRILMSCFSNDDQGRKRVVMRAVVTPEGCFEQQRNPNGDQVGFFGDWWAVNMRKERIGGAPAFIPKPVPRQEHCSERSNNSRSSENHRSSSVQERDSRSSSSYRSDHFQSRDSRDDDRSHYSSSSRGRSESHYEGRRSYDDHSERRSSGVNVGAVLGRVAEVAAPFVMAKLLGGHCHDGWGNNYYRNYGYDRYGYDGNGSGYDHRYHSQQHYHQPYSSSYSRGGYGNYYSGYSSDYSHHHHSGSHGFLGGLLNFGRSRSSSSHSHNKGKHCR